MVAEKISPVDRVQVLTMLHGILSYLDSADVVAASCVAYDEPLIIIRNLVISLEEVENARFNKSALSTPKPSVSKNVV